MQTAAFIYYEMTLTFGLSENCIYQRFKDVQSYTSEKLSMHVFKLNIQQVH